jgi:hypothetical protein
MIAASSTSTVEQRAMIAASSTSTVGERAP